ncbi:MAG: DUF4136 domain-containing protein [Sediminibacterium sp.]
MVVGVLLLSGCARKAYMQKDEHFNFSKIKTYSWVDAVPEKESTAKKGKINDLTDRKIRESVDRNLEQKGWRESNQNPDVLLVYEVVVDKSNRNVSTPVYSMPLTRWVYNPWGRRWVPIYYPSQFIGYDNTTETVKESTLTLTIMDAVTDKTVWQGWVTSDINGKQMTDADINANVKAIVKKLG